MHILNGCCTMHIITWVFLIKYFSLIKHGYIDWVKYILRIIIYGPLLIHTSTRVLRKQFASRKDRYTVCHITKIRVGSAIGAVIYYFIKPALYLSLFVKNSLTQIFVMNIEEKQLTRKTNIDIHTYLFTKRMSKIVGTLFSCSKYHFSPRTREHIR